MHWDDGYVTGKLTTPAAAVHPTVPWSIKQSVLLYAGQVLY